MKNEDLEKHIDALKVLIDKEQYEAAVDYYIDFIDLNSNKNIKIIKGFLNEFMEIHISDEAYLLLKGFLYLDINLNSKALEFYTKAIDVKPNYDIAYVNRGNLYCDLKKYNNAILDYNKALELDKNSADSYNGRGNAYRSLKKYDKALSDYDKAIKLDEDFVDSYHSKGIVYRSLKDYNNAVKNYTKVLELDPNYSYSYYNRGLVFLDKNNKEKAIEDFSSYIGLAPKDADGYLQRGKIYKELELYADAIDDFMLMHDYEEDSYWKEWALKEIKELKEELKNVEIRNIQSHVDVIKKTLLFKGKLITHYTDTFGTKALLLNDESSFRMSEANYMNDTTEGEKLKIALFGKENYLDDNKIPFIEKPFLGSFVDDQKCNDLTLWRMYAKTNGIDGQGFAITLHRDKLFDIMVSTFTNQEKPDTGVETFNENHNKVILNNSKSTLSSSDSNEFQFYKVAYLDENGKCVGKGQKAINTAINGLKKSFESIKNKKDDNLLQKGLERLSEVEYLFKGVEYQHESEVRLVLSKIGKQKDIKVYNGGDIQIPKVFLYIGNILSAVESITIGPKVERPKEWASAFNYNFLEKGMKKSKVYISRLPYK